MGSEVIGDDADGFGGIQMRRQWHHHRGREAHELGVPARVAEKGRHPLSGLYVRYALADCIDDANDIDTRRERELWEARER